MAINRFSHLYSTQVRQAQLYGKFLKLEAPEYPSDVSSHALLAGNAEGRMKCAVSRMVVSENRMTRHSKVITTSAQAAAAQPVGVALSGQEVVVASPALPVFTEMFAEMLGVLSLCGCAGNYKKSHCQTQCNQEKVSHTTLLCDEP
jgi:hypothetical protein